MGLTANELSSYRGPEVQILSPPPEQLNTAPVAQRIEHLTTDQKVGGSNPFGRAIKYWLTCWLANPCAVNPFEALVVTRMSQGPSNSCAVSFAGRDNLPQRFAGGSQCVVLGVGVSNARKDSQGERQ